MNLLKSRKILFPVAIVIVVGAVFILRTWWFAGNNTGYAPEQPFPFSHKKHAGDNQIPCMYCHSNADNSKHATIPPMQVCMNCHRVVKTDSPLIQQVTEMYNSGKAFEWVKVHDLPDFVYFSHKRHILKGFACAECHGDVASMVRIKQVKPLTMGFCINCHRANKGPQDCYTCHH